MLKLSLLVVVVVGIAAMTVPAFTATSLTSTADAQGKASVATNRAAASDVSTKAVERKSAKCKSPKNKKINISWGDGSESTTVYFNNHCAQKRAIQLQFGSNQSGHYRCITVNAKTSGKKKIGFGRPHAVRLPAKC